MTRRPPSASGRALALALALVGATACAPVIGEAYLNAVSAGERAYGAGRFEEAARAFDDAAGKATRVKDRDEARLLHARALQRAERWPEARASYERLVRESPEGPRTARARFEIADLALAHGDPQQGFALLADAVRRHPDHGLAASSLFRLADHEAESGGPEGALRWLASVAPAMRSTELDQTVTFATARWLERAGRPAEAVAAYLRAAREHPYPHGALTDDAYWYAAELELSAERPAVAIAILRELLSARESPSQTLGSYERPRFSQAQMRIAEITRDKLHDRAAARREFHRLFTVHTTSILRDDALWAEALLARDDGDAAETCRLVRTLVSDLPDSRFARCARVLCPDAPAPKGARECPDYVVRELHPGAPTPGDTPEP